MGLGDIPSPAETCSQVAPPPLPQVLGIPIKGVSKAETLI